MKALPPQHKKYRNIYSVMGFLFMKVSKTTEDVFVGMQKMSLKQSQCITCAREVSDHTGLHLESARRALEHLEEFGEIKRETNNRYTLVTLIDFELTREC